MNYTVNPNALAAPFFLPASIADNHLKIATRDQLRVILYIFRNTAEHPDVKSIAEALNISVDDVNDAICYWADAGILCCETVKEAETVNKRTKARLQSEKPSREEIAVLGSNDEKLPFLFSEIQKRLCRPLRQNETSSFAWLYCEEGMDVSVILMLVEYAIGLNKANIRFIEKTAIQWLNAGVEDIASAEEYMQNSAKTELCSKTLAAAFGIRDRKLNKTERDLALLWINEHSFDRKMLETAYDLCVDATGSYNIKYIKGIIERWIKDGVKTAEDIKKSSEKKPKTTTPKQDYSAIDKDLLEKMLNADN